MEQDILYSDFLLFMVVMGTRMGLALGERTQSWLKSPSKRKSMYFSPLERDIFICSYVQFEHILWSKATQQKQRCSNKGEKCHKKRKRMNRALLYNCEHKTIFGTTPQVKISTSNSSNLKHKKRIQTLRIDSVSQLTPGSLLQDPPQQDVTSWQSKHCAVDFIRREIQALG